MNRRSKHNRRKRKTCRLGTPNRENAVGYCHLHNCNMTHKQMRNRQCLKKGCKNFVPWKQHPYWTQRAQTKNLWWEKEDNTDDIQRVRGEVSPQ